MRRYRRVCREPAVSWFVIYTKFFFWLGWNEKPYLLWGCTASILQLGLERSIARFHSDAKFREWTIIAHREPKIKMYFIEENFTVRYRVELNAIVSCIELASGRAEASALRLNWTCEKIYWTDSRLLLVSEWMKAMQAPFLFYLVETRPLDRRGYLRETGLAYTDRIERSIVDQINVTLLAFDVEEPTDQQRYYLLSWGCHTHWSLFGVTISFQRQFHFLVKACS